MPGGRLRDRVTQLKKLKQALKGGMGLKEKKPDEGLDPESDQALMALVCQGDKQAYRKIVERYINRTVALSQRFVADPMEAEDISQEVFLTLWRNARAWQPEKASLSTWLYRITVNRAIDFKRKMRFDALDPQDEPQDQSMDAVSKIHTMEVSRKLRMALTQLSEPQQVAMALYYHEGLTAAHCAEVMETNLNAVESLLKRARARLRELMSGEPGMRVSDMELKELSLY